MENKTKIVVSLTSYPKRIQDLHKVVKTLLIQTLKPDEIIIWLAKEEFPKQNEDLPKELTELCKYGLSIRWVSGNLRSHKKYYYVMQEYYNDIIITVDDDIHYSPELVESLYHSYVLHPHAVSCARANLICTDGQGNLSPYKEWEKNYSYCADIEAMDLLAVGCGGVLYPPKCFDLGVLCDVDSIEKCCLYQDDLWLKANEITKNIPTVLVKEYRRLAAPLIKGTQDVALCENINVNGNDAALKSLDNYFKLRDYKTFCELIFSNENTIENWLKSKNEKNNKIIEKFRNQAVYIYGAGEGAKSTYGCLASNKMESMIKGFVVTRIDNNPKTLFDIPVIQIDEVKNQDCLIIISTADKLQEEIVRTLKERGFDYILSVNNVLIGEFNNSLKKLEEVKRVFLTLCRIE